MPIKGRRRQARLLLLSLRDGAAHKPRAPSSALLLKEDPVADPFLGEIRLFSFAFAPKNWAQCNGQLLPVQQNQALFALLGVRYGGNGTTNFNLPDLRGRVPLSYGVSPVSGTSYAIANNGGAETVAITTTAMPAHNHTYAVSNGAATRPGPNNSRYYAASSPANLYATAMPDVALNSAAIDTIGGGQGHPNMQPFLTINFCIALAGIYPPRN